MQTDAAHPSISESASFKFLESALKKYCSLFHCMFRDMLTKLVLERVSMDSDVHPLLTDPLYNILRKENKPNSDYNALTSEE